jgi:NADPH:quinone reductase-like Zn-dependent oxidoreductase
MLTTHFPQKQADILGSEVAGTIGKLGPGILNHTLGKRIAAALTIHPIGQVDRNKAIGSAYDG